MKDQINTAFNALTEKLQGWLTAIVESLPNLVLAILVMLAAYFISKYIKKLTYRLVSKGVHQDSISRMISKLSSVIVVAVALFLVLGILNLSKALTSLLAGAGVVGLAIGLALQGTLANTFAGVVLSFRKNIQIGNWVETNDFSGEVIDINLKNFVLKEADNNMVLIPNKSILDSPLKNYSLTSRMRIGIECGVGYESDLEKVKSLTRNTIANSFENIKSADEVEFYYTEFGGSSINFLCRFWIDGEKAIEKLKARSKAVIEIKKAFDTENINIPFPIRTLQFDNQLSLNTTELEELKTKK